jgi:hypothetical protein
VQKSAPPHMTPMEELEARVLAHDTVLRCLIGLLKPDEAQFVTQFLTGTCENLAIQPPPQAPGAVLQREYLIRLLKGYLPRS